MEFLRIHTTKDLNFKAAWQLYQDAFPANEKRSFKQQAQILKEEKYHFNTIEVEGNFIGIIMWWEFDALKFIDHFAILEEHRSKGYGKIILDKINQESQKQIILEVELPSNTQNQRRINFYQRIGYVLNPFNYDMPSYTPGEDPVKLLLMSYPNPLPKEEVDYFVNQCHPIIYGNS